MPPDDSGVGPGRIRATRNRPSSKWQQSTKGRLQRRQKPASIRHEGVSLYSYLVLSSQAVATSSEQLYTTLELCTAVAHD